MYSLLLCGILQIRWSKRRCRTMTMTVQISLLLPIRKSVIKHHQIETQRFLFPHTCCLSRWNNSKLNWACFKVKTEALVVIDCWRRWTRSCWQWIQSSYVQFKFQNKYYCNVITKPTPPFLRHCPFLTLPAEYPCSSPVTNSLHCCAQPFHT